jgi:PAS domain S-box-containing protein
MNILDVRTVLFSYGISNAICAAVIATLWRQNRRRSPELGFWLADFCLQFVAVVLIALGGILPDFISILFGTPLVIGGTLLLFIGLERYTGKTSSQLHNYILLAILVFLHAYFTFVQPSLLARNLIISLGLLAICSQCAWLLLRRVDPKIQPGTRAVGVVFVFYSLVSFIRIFADLVVQPGNDFFRSDIYDTLAILIYQMLFIGLTFSLFLMVNRRLFGALERDILELKLAEEEIQSLSRFPLENPNPILRIARNGRILYANPVSGPILAAWGREVGQEVPGDWCERIESASESGKPKEVEMDCQGRIFSCSLTPIANEDYVNIYGRDITKRKQSEQALRETSDYLENLFNYANAPIIVWDPGFRITRFNRAFERLTGHKAEEVIGKHLEMLFPTDSRKTSMALIAQTSGGEHWESVEIPILQREGKVRLVLWNSANLLAGDGQTVVATIAQGQDITERKQAEEAIKTYSEKLQEMVEEGTRELRRAQEKLVRQEKLAMLGQLAGSVSHELRNPLGVISNAVYLINMTQPEADAKVKGYLDIIEKETRTADKIITDLLDFSRIRSVDGEVVVVAELAAAVLERYPAPEGVEVTLKFPKNLPPVFADPHHLTQVLGNLVINACQAMPTAHLKGDPGGKLVISGRRVDAIGIDLDEGQTYVAIAVKDSGVGISPDIIGKLFEPLFTTKARGIGLGLSICKNLVEANGGMIEVQSEPGRGSTFTVYIPIYKEIP